MTEAVRRRVAIMRLAMDEKDIREFSLDPRSFRMPDWLQVPEEMQHAQIGLLRRASQTIDAMKQLMARREDRYYGMCPKEPEHAYNVHKTSIDRLFQWKPDWIAEDPTLAPAVNIPRDGVQFQLDPSSYANFTLDYISMVEVFMDGSYKSWLKYKKHVEHMASRVMSEIDYLTWRDWWDNTFLQAMWKWEVCLEGLIIPRWEEVVDEIYLLILERVENATEVANSLCSGRFSSRMNTPHLQDSTAAQRF